MKDVKFSLAEMLDLQKRVKELEQTLHAIQGGEVDALIVKNKKGEASIFTLEGQDEPYRILVESMSEGALTLTETGIIIHCNKRFADIINCSTHEIIGTSFFDYVPIIEHKSLKKLLKECKTRHCKKDFKLKGANNPIKAVLLSCHTVQLGTINGISLVVTDITKLMETQTALEHLANFDPLTNLANRYLFEIMLNKSLARANRHKSTLALIYIDLDYFKNVNDLFGHSVGDSFLIKVSRRLKKSIRVEDFIARLGGDEFAIILEDIHNISTINVTLNHIADKFKHPFSIGKFKITSTLSIGIAVYPSSETTADTIIQHADQALYQAKNLGRNCYKYYNNSMQEQLERYMLIVNHLRRAIQKNQLELLYQPKIDTRTNEIIGVEALLRWKNPYIENLIPEEFIVIAEEAGLINPIGAWVIQKALQQYKEWSNVTHKMRHIKIAINISAKQLDADTINDTLSHILSKSQVPLDCILLEITETAVMRKILTNKSALEKLLIRLGVGVSIDDFGTGYSSLIYLKQLPIKELKIDKSFINDIGRSKTNEAIIQAIINLAKALNLDVVAEGVETKEQVEFLSAHQCNIVQGYYFSKPLSAIDMLAYINS